MQRLDVNVNAETAAALRRYSASRRVTATETVRRAVELLDLVEWESGGELLLRPKREAA